MSRSTNSLDEPEIKRDLKKAILLARDQLIRNSDALSRLKAELDDFDARYQEKIKNLSHILEELNRALFKYRSISENVDAHFTFAEAEEIFEETLREREQDFNESYARSRLIENPAGPVIELTEPEKKEIKSLYRALARIYHPDMKGGNEATMMVINKAYARGDIVALREIYANNVVDSSQENSMESLKQEFRDLMENIRTVKKEITALRKSEQYSLKKSFLKHHPSIEEGLDELANSIRREISGKKQAVQKLKEKIERRSPVT